MPDLLQYVSCGDPERRSSLAHEHECGSTDGGSESDMSDFEDGCGAAGSTFVSDSETSDSPDSHKSSNCEEAPSEGSEYFADFEFSVDSADAGSLQHSSSVTGSDDAQFPTRMPCIDLTSLILQVRPALYRDG